MRNILFINLLLFPLIISAQGRHTGDFFPNEAITFHKIRKENRHNHPLYSPAEVFLKISEMGKYKVSIEDQSIENSTGMFRFFDINSGRHILSVYENGNLIYQSSFYARAGHRLVFDLSYNGLYLLEDINLNTPKFQPPHQIPRFFNNKRVMSNEEFEHFLKEIVRKRFDDKIAKAFKMRSISTAFSTDQIIRVLKNISFDNEKLPLAKHVFKDCIDPENYHKVIDVLDFIPSKNELKKFIENYYK